MVSSPDHHNLIHRCGEYVRWEGGGEWWKRKSDMSEEVIDINLGGVWYGGGGGGGRRAYWKE